LQAGVGNVQHGEVGDDPVDHTQASERQFALLKNLRAAVLGVVLHQHHDALDAGDQIHRAAHALDHLAGDHPVSQIAFLRHLHRTQDRQVDMSATDHGEGVGTVEETAPGQTGNSLLASVDKVRVDLVFLREGANAEQAILTLQPYIHAFGDV